MLVATPMQTEVSECSKGLHVRRGGERFGEAEGQQLGDLLRGAHKGRGKVR